MAKVSKYHSVLEDVYHDNNTCKLGTNIQAGHLKLGTGGKELCSYCKDIETD